MSCPRQRPVFKWRFHKTVATQESSFGPFPRDLATYLMHRIKDFHVLLMLKSISKATANCVRNAINSCAEEGYDPFETWFGHFYAALNCSTLSFPIQAMYHHKMHMDWCGRKAAFLNTGKRLIVHELAFEVRDRDGVLKTNNEVIRWLANVSNIMHWSSVEIDQDNDELFAAKNELVCYVTRFVVEWPGVGIFREPEQLVEELGLRDYVQEKVLQKRSNGKKPLVGDFYVTSKQDIFELLVRLTPYTRIGELVVGFDHHTLDHDCIPSSPNNSSLLYHILLDRVLYS